MQEKVTTLEIPFFKRKSEEKRKSSETKKRAVITQALLNRIDFNAEVKF